MKVTNVLQEIMDYISIHNLNAIRPCRDIEHDFVTWMRSRGFDGPSAGTAARKWRDLKFVDGEFEDYHTFPPNMHPKEVQKLNKVNRIKVREMPHDGPDSLWQIISIDGVPIINFSQSIEEALLCR